jgi:hypothetical protein
LHYDRWRATGDPNRKSRFDTEAEKAAFIAAERAKRHTRQSAERQVRQAEQEASRLLRRRAVKRIAPEARAMSKAIDALPEDERAAVVSLVVSSLMGRPVDITEKESHP